ncbi:MAG: EthD family reductase [Methylococcaceae bacterium]
MIKISILYPNNDNAYFDVDYYLNNHIPLAMDYLSSHSGFRGMSIEQGIGSSVPNQAAAYLIMCHFIFESLEDFMQAFMPHAPQLQADIPNYTDINPIIQISNILMAQ